MVKGWSGSADTNRVSRCPQCAAAAPDAAKWCSLCYADLHPQGSSGSPVAASIALDRAPGRQVRPRQGTVAVSEGQDLPPVADLPDSDEELFALLRSDHGVDPLASWSQRFQDPRLRWAVAGGGALVLVSFLVLLATVFGSLLRN